MTTPARRWEFGPLGRLVAFMWAVVSIAQRTCALSNRLSYNAPRHRSDRPSSMFGISTLADAGNGAATNVSGSAHSSTAANTLAIGPEVNASSRKLDKQPFVWWIENRPIYNGEANNPVDTNETEAAFFL